MQITVKTPVFEGPLDILLELIEKRKLLINDISLASVADEYMQRIQAIGTFPVGEAAEFIALAATLLLIKSRSLLPNLLLSDDESHDIKELEYRLAVYQIIKEAGKGLERLDLPPLHEGKPVELPPLYIKDASVTAASLLEAAQALIAGFPQNLTLPKVAVKKIISIEEMIERMAGRVQQAVRMSFREFAGKRERTEVIVGFLALLELVKQGILKAEQQEEHGDITLESDSVGTPRYGSTDSNQDGGEN